MLRLGVLFCLLLPVPAVAQATKTRKAPEKSESVKAIPGAIQQFVENGTVSGAVTLVARKGRILSIDAVGHADIESGRPMKPNTLFAIASMTKPVTATALLILQDEGKLRVDDEIRKYIPEFASVRLRDGVEPSRPLTIRDAVTHTSGLGGSQLFTGTLEEAAHALAKRELLFQPGTQWKYSPGMNVAGRVIEVVSGERYADFLKQRIFDPLGMNSTGFVPAGPARARVATIYGPNEDKTGLAATANHITPDPTAVKSGNPSGGLFSTARDLFRFYQMILNRGRFRGTRIVSVDAVKEMTSAQTADLQTGFTPGNAWGLGWCIVQQPQGVTSMLSPGTFGHGGAFGTQGWVDPVTKSIYVLMIQRRGMGNSDGSAIRRKFQELASK